MAYTDAYKVLTHVQQHDPNYRLAAYQVTDAGNQNKNGFALYYAIKDYDPEKNTFEMRVAVVRYRVSELPITNTSSRTYRLRYGESVFEWNDAVNTNDDDGFIYSLLNQKITVPADESFVFRLWVELDCNIGIMHLSSVTVEKTLNFPHQNRRSSLSLPSMTLGSQAVLTVNKLVSRATHKIQYTVTKTGVTGTIVSNSSSTSISWTPPMDAANGTTDDIYVRFRLKIETFIDGVSEGTDDEHVSIFIPQSVHPTVSIRVSDGNGFSSIFDNRWLHDRSTYRVIATATKSYGSPIIECRTKIIGSTKEGNSVNVSYYGDDITSDVLNLVGTVKIVTTVYDERGRSGTAEVSVSAIEYKPPVITALIIHRCNQNGEENDQGEYVSIAFSSSVQALNNKNTASYRYAYKSSVATSYTTAELPSLSGNYAVNNHTIVIPADSSYTYDIYVEAEDRITSFKRSVKASTGFTIINFHTTGKGIAFGKVSEHENVFDINFETMNSGGLRYPLLDKGTDLDELCSPSCIYLCGGYDYEFINTPTSIGYNRMIVEVIDFQNGSAMQIYKTHSKNNPVEFVRYYDSGAWGEWHQEPNFYKPLGFMKFIRGVIIEAENRTNGVKGVGIASVVILGNIAEINVTARIVRSGIDNAYSVRWGIDRDILKDIEPSIPHITPVSGGNLIIYNSDGTINTGLSGYGGTFENINNRFWLPGRVYDYSGNNGSVGGWQQSLFTEGMYLVGTCYGNL